jgi:hypothetical protein
MTLGDDLDPLLLLQIMKNQVTTVKPIKIAIGYGWSDHGDKKNGLNAHWAFLRDEIKTVIGMVKNQSSKRSKALHPLRVEYSRLRARHGMGALNGILKKIKDSDILIFDISKHNANVLFELGYAMAAKGQDSGRIFIFREETHGEKTPSDLEAFMRSEYQLLPAQTSKSKGRVLKFAKMNDGRGFKGAMLSIIKEIAEERSMWGQAKATLELEEGTG